MKVCEKVPKSYPCSNRPVKCDFCNEIYWRNNIKAQDSNKHDGINFKSLITKKQVMNFILTLSIH